MRTAPEYTAWIHFDLAPPSLFFEPKRYRPHGVGYWSGHIPFACDLIYSVRPKVLVELGTHLGESYFTFCQAIAESGCDCRAYAVDTWRGDQHTGAYSGEVFAEVTACNAEYRSFSTLVRRRFEEALPEFEGEAIDVLHIDGSHIYEDVRRDFEQWWPKVRAGGTVLFHDSYERGHGFGVWRLLGELREKLPGNEFVHSHGLGVVTKPPAPAESSLGWEFALATGAETRETRRYYETCAGALRDRYLLAGRKRSDWEVVSQLLWLATGRTEYREEDSVRASELVTGDGVSVLLPFPPEPNGYTQFEVRPSLVPAMVSMEELAIVSAAGKTIFHKAGDRLGLRAWKTKASGVLVDEPERSAFRLQLPSPVLKGMANGGAVQLRLRGLDPTSISRELVKPGWL